MNHVLNDVAVIGRGIRSFKVFDLGLEPVDHSLAFLEIVDHELVCRVLELLKLRLTYD